MMKFLKSLSQYDDEKDKLVKMITPLKRDLSILDVGCGTGRNLDLFKKYNFKNIVGVEINPDLIAIAKKKRAPSLFRY